MNPASPNLSASATRVPQLYVRKFRLEVQEAEHWQVPQPSPLQIRLRKRAWMFVGSLAGASALLLWAGWHWIHP